MKISVFLFFFGLLNLVAGSTYSQNTKISLDMKDASIESVLNKIEEISEFYFLFNHKLIDVDRKVDVTAEEEPIRDILGEIFPSEVSIIVIDRQIVLTPAQGSTTLEALILQQTVSGKVTDLSTGEPMPGVNIQIKGTIIGTISDASGKYSISVTDRNATLVFSFVGYSIQELPLNGRVILDVTLTAELRGLDEVVVIGYGTKAKGALTGAISTANNDIFEMRPVSNGIESLQGVLPGVVITKGSGRPGVSSTLQIRGYSSINGNVPLVLVDGIPGDLNLINTNDIANISVLKDAAASIYGARAGDGVILVTTKKGEKGIPRVSYSMNFGIKSPDLPTLTNTLQYAEMVDESLANADAPRIPAIVFERIKTNAPPDLTEGGGWNIFFEQFPSFYGSVDWPNIMYEPSSQQMHNLSISGGTENNNYLLSVGYNKNNGNINFAKDDFDRYNIRLNYDYFLFNRLKIETRTSFDNTVEIVPSLMGSIIPDIVRTLSYIPLYNLKGQYYQYQDYRNPADMAQNGGYTTNRNLSFTTNLKAELEIIDGLKLISQAGYILNPYKSVVINKTFSCYDWEGNFIQTRNSPNSATYVNKDGIQKLFNGYLDYNKTFAIFHNIGLMIGGSYESFETERQSVVGYNFASNNQVFTLNLMDKSSASYLTNITGTASGWALASYFSRFSYTFRDQLFLDISLRSDGSSKFEPDKRWSAIFPAVAFAYNLSELGFMKSHVIFDLLKIRLSWGQAGNQDISNLGLYDYMSTISIVPGIPLGAPNVSILSATPTISSATRTWEKITNKNIGIDLSILKSRLAFSFDYFNKTNSDMLVNLNVAQTFGGTPPSQNAGKLVTKGFETSILWKDRVADFQYSVSFQLSDSKDKLVELKNTDSYREGLNKTRQGYPINSYFGYVSEGIIKTQEQLTEYKKLGGTLPQELNLGDLMYKDLDGDGKITAFGDKSKGFDGDMTYLGNATPRYIYSSNISVSYKGLDFQLFLQGVGKRSAIYLDPFSRPLNSVYWQPLAYFYEKTWTPNRPNAPEPRLTPGEYLLDNVLYWNVRYSSHRMQSAAYMRVKVISLGYSFPSSMLSFMGNDHSLRIYLSGQDIFTLKTKAIGGNYDPENGANSLYNYPFNKIYSIGLDFKF